MNRHFVVLDGLAILVLFVVRLVLDACLVGKFVFVCFTQIFHLFGLR